jgi:hypothetical protein
LHEGPIWLGNPFRNDSKSSSRRAANWSLTAKAQTGVSPQRRKLESHRKGANRSLTAKAQTGVSPQRRKGRQGEQPGEEMEVKFGGSQSRSEFAGPFAYWPSDLRLSGSQAHRSRWVEPVGRSRSPTWFAISGLHRGGTRQDRSIR